MRTRPPAQPLLSGGLGLLMTLVVACSPEPPVTVEPQAEGRRPTPDATADSSPAAPATDTSQAIQAPPPRTTAPAPAPDLLARRELELGGRPLGLATLDVDGDGFEDLAAVTEMPGQLHLFLGGPDGLRPAGVAPVGAFPTRPLWVPATASSPAVLLVGSKADRSLQAFRVTRVVDQLGVEPAWSLDLGGVPRVLARRAGEPSVTWLDREGRVADLAWSGLERIAQEPPTPWRALDLGRDPRPVDLLLLADGGRVVLCQGDRSLRLIDDRSGPAGALLEVGQLAFDPDGDGVPRSATEGDLDGDGDLEQAFFGGDRRVLVFGLGSAESQPGGFVHAPGEPLALTQPNLVPLAASARDLNGDGRDELVALGVLDQGYSVLGGFTSDGARWRAEVAVSEYAGQDPWDLVLGDFDGDGLADLVSACRGAAALSLLNGTGIVRQGKPAFHQAGRVGVGANPLSIAAVDTSGDGKPEVATLDAADGRLSLLSNDGFGTLTLATRLAVGPAPRALAALELAVPGGPGGPGEAGARAGVLVALAVPPGAGGRLVAFGPGSPAAQGGFGPLQVVGAGGGALADLPAAEEADLAVGDLDGDGSDDVALLDRAAGEVVLLYARGLAAGQLRLERGAAVALAGHAGPRGLAILQRPEGVRLAVGGLEQALLLDPAGGPEARQVIPRPGSLAGSRGVGRVAAGDLSGDGYDDLVVLWLGAQGTSPGVLAVDETLGGLHMSFELPTGLAPADLAVADLNGDGKAELVVAAQNSHMVQVWVNAGERGFPMAPAVGVGLGPVDLCLVDLLGNGLADLLVANAFSADISRVLNRPRR